MAKLSWTKTGDGELVSAGGRFAIRHIRATDASYYLIFEGVEVVTTRRYLRNAKALCNLLHLSLGKNVNLSAAHTDGGS